METSYQVFGNFLDAVRSAYRQDYTMLENTDACLNHKSFEYFTNALRQSRKSLLTNSNYPTRLVNFYIALFFYKINDMKKENEVLNALKERIMFKSLNSLRNSEPLGVCPRIVVTVLARTKDYKPSEFVDINDVWNYMKKYFEHSEEPQLSRPFVGLLLTFESVDIVWIQDFIPGTSPKAKQVNKYTLEWSISLKYFMEELNQIDITTGRLKESSLSETRLYNISQFYVFLDFIWNVSTN